MNKLILSQEQKRILEKIEVLSNIMKEVAEKHGLIPTSHYIALMQNSSVFRDALGVFMVYEVSPRDRIFRRNFRESMTTLAEQIEKTA